MKKASATVKFLPRKERKNPRLFQYSIRSSIVLIRKFFYLKLAYSLVEYLTRVIKKSDAQSLAG